MKAFCKNFFCTIFFAALSTSALSEEQTQESSEAADKSPVSEQAKRLADKADDSPRFCAKVRPRSGSRIPRLKCRTLAQIERDNELNQHRVKGARQRHRSDPYNVGVWKPDGT